MKITKTTLIISMAAICLAGVSAIVRAADSLGKDFATPPAACKPGALFFFENNTMDLPGITADLEALASVGIGNLWVFAEYRPGMKEGSAKMFSPEYGTGIRHLLREAERLGIVVSIFNCSGSATAGGPWNSAEQSMKQFVWSETSVTGGGPKTLKLKQPLTVGGFYRDIGVTAYPLAAGTIPTDVRTPKITVPRASGKIADLTDGDILSRVFFSGESVREPREIRFEYARPLKAGRLFVYGNLFRYVQPIKFYLECSDDGQAWKKIATLTQNGNSPAVVDFPPVTAQHFRVWASCKMDNFWIAELELLPPDGRPKAYPQFDDWNAATWRFGMFHPQLLGKDQPLNIAKAVDLTAKMRPDGTLQWDAPAGEWLVLRTGYTTTGKKNNPAKGEGEGYEVDKFNPVHVRRHAEEGLRQMTGGATNIRSLQSYHVDSWEAGGQSWSENLPAEFERRNGYSLQPFLPVLAAKVVADADTTRRFLEDYRRTLQALVTESFFGVIQSVAHSNGLAFDAESTAAIVSYVRPLDYFQYVDVPEGEAWSLGNFSSAGNISGGLRDAISAAHIYGRPVTPVEVFTSQRGDWNMSPRFLKPFGDKVLAAGGNHLVLHCYIHQPSGDRAPGWTMTRFGTTFNRHVTWWNEAKPWLASVARSQVLLRQGRNVSDFCRLLGEEESIVNPDFGNRQTFWDAPAGYANDWITGGNLVNLFRVENGEFVAKGGARYRLLVLPEKSDRMTLETARKLHELVEAGGVILGRRPAARAGLRGGEAADSEFAQHLAALWDDNTQTAASRAVGKGRVLSGVTVDNALAELGIKPDVTWAAADEPPQVYWQHRRDDQREIYFLANPGDKPLRAAFSFRVTGRAPQCWSPETGAIRLPALYRSAADRTELPLELGPGESTFVVFAADSGKAHFENVRRDGQPLWPGSQPPLAGLPNVFSQPDGTVTLESALPGEYVLETAQQKTVAAKVTPAQSLELHGAWRVSFTGVAAPAPQVFEQLTGWEKHSDPAVRFFSGSAEYRKEFTLDAKFIADNARVTMDLGELRELAEVTLNGEKLGVFWKAPFRADLSGKLRAGRNEIAVRVVNTWANRLIGDAALPEAERQTWMSYKHYEKSDTLPPSGLLGPVTLRSEGRVVLKN